MTGITILVFCLQLSGQYGLFVQLPERVKVIHDKIDVIENGMHAGRTKHEVTEKEVDTLERYVDRIVKRFDDLEVRVHGVEKTIYQKSAP